MSDDLVIWLRAQLDEDEQVALAAGNRNWLVEDNTITLWPLKDDDGYMAWPTRADARHAAHHDPARALREVAAKRAIVDECAWTAKAAVATSAVAGLAELVLKRLAAVYADRPGYRGEWAP